MNKRSTQHELVLFGVLNDEFVAGCVTYWLRPADPPGSICL